MTDSSESEDDTIPLSEMVRKSKKVAPPAAAAGGNNNNRRSQRLLVRPLEKEKKVAAKTKKTRQKNQKSKAAIVASPRKTRAMRKRAAAEQAAKVEQDDDDEGNNSKEEESSLSSSESTEAEQSEGDTNDEADVSSSSSQGKSNDDKVNAAEKNDTREGDNGMADASPLGKEPKETEPADAPKDVSNQETKSVVEKKVTSTLATDSVEEMEIEEPNKLKDADKPNHDNKADDPMEVDEQQAQMKPSDPSKEDISRKSEAVPATSIGVPEKGHGDDQMTATQAESRKKDIISPPEPVDSSNDDKQTDDATTVDSKKPFDATVSESSGEAVPAEKGGQTTKVSHNNAHEPGQSSTVEPIETSDDETSTKPVNESVDKHTVMDPKVSSEQESDLKTKEQVESHQKVTEATLNAGDKDSSQTPKSTASNATVSATEKSQVMSEGDPATPRTGDETEKGASPGGTLPRSKDKSVEAKANATSRVDETKVAMSDEVPAETVDRDTAPATATSPMDLLAKLADASVPSEKPKSGALAPSSKVKVLTDVAGDKGGALNATESEDVKHLAPAASKVEASRKSKDTNIVVRDDGRLHQEETLDDKEEVAHASRQDTKKDVPMTRGSTSQLSLEGTKVRGKNANVSSTGSKKASVEESTPTSSRTGEVEVANSSVPMDEDGTAESMEVELTDSQMRDMEPMKGLEGNPASKESHATDAETDAGVGADDIVTETNESVTAMEMDSKAVAISDNAKDDQTAPRKDATTTPDEAKTSRQSAAALSEATQTVDVVLAGVVACTPPVAAEATESPEIANPTVYKEPTAGSSASEREAAKSEPMHTTGESSQNVSTSADDGIKAAVVARAMATDEPAIERIDDGKTTQDDDDDALFSTAASIPSANDSGGVSAAVEEAVDNSVATSPSGDSMTAPVPMAVDSTDDNEQEPMEAETVPGVADKVEKTGISPQQKHQAEVHLKKVKRSGTTKESEAKIRVPVRTTMKRPEAEETAALLEAFPNMAKRKIQSDSKSRKRPRKQLSIRISGVVPTNSEEDKGNPETSSAVEPIDSSGTPLRRGIPGTPITFGVHSELVSKLATECDSSFQDDRDLEETLAFFSETHEEQDPAYIESEQTKESNRLKNELANLKKTYEVGVAKINTIIASQMNEKQSQADKNIEKLRGKQLSEEQKDLQRLQEAYGQKMKSNNNKINEGIKLMTKRQSEQMQKAHLQHRQQAQQRGIPEQIIANEWGPLAQRIQAKQQQALNEFNAKGEEAKKRYEAEYQREKEKYVNHHKQRREDLESNLQKVFAKIRSQFQQQHQRYLKAHTLRLKKRREEILSLLAESEEDKRTAAKDATKDSMKEELRSPSPIALRFAPANDPHFDSSGASSRSKNRKTILIAVRKQLSIEIHNEGLWISIMTEKGDDAKKNVEKSQTDGSDSKNSEFLPWGVKARGVLQSVISGEIPSGYGTDRFDFGDAIAAQGGHIRCVVVDLRTSEETASAQRVAGMKAQEAESIKALQDKVEELSRHVADADAHNAKAVAEEKDMNALHEKTMKDVEKAKTLVQQLRTKFKSLLGPDDVPLPSLKESDRQKLTAAMGKYTANVAAHEARLQAVETALYEKKVKTQKTMTLQRQANKAVASAASVLKKKRAQATDNKPSRRLSEAMEADRASTRVADVIGGLEKAAEARREQLNLKRSSAASTTYIQSLPGLPNGLKKSLWHKMHRRRQQIVLRPSMEFVVKDVKDAAEEAEFYAKDRSSTRRSKEDIGTRAEQLFLLSAFPEQSSNTTPSTPPLDSHVSWAEPGWHVNLDVPKVETIGSRSILPRVHVPPVMQKSHSEFSSAPGRQVASLISTTHLQALNTPLSAAAQAISLAETSPVANESKVLSENDPFNTTEAAMKSGYTFAVRSSPSKSSSSQSRRKTTPSKAASTPSASPVSTPSPRKLAKGLPKPTSVEKVVPIPPTPPTPSPVKRSSSTASRKTPTKATATKTDKPTKPKRSRSKSSATPGSSPRAKATKKTVDSTPAGTVAAADAASQARTYAMQQQAAANALYGQQQMDQQAVQYSPSYMKQVAASQANLQGLQAPPLQPPTMATAAQPQLIPQAPYGSYSPQQRQLAQMRMMQQQQGRPAGFPPQQQPNMQFYPAAMQAAARQQAAYGSQQAMAAAASMQQQVHRRTASAEERNDPIFMLPDGPPPPPPSKKG